MTIGKILARLAIVVCVATLAWLWNIRAILQTEHDLVFTAAAEVEQLRRENQELANQLPLGAQANAGPAELALLRNEVGRLRQEQQSIDRLRRENAQLSAGTTARGSTSRLPQTAGYLSRSDWTNTGSATPEAAIQTFFEALRREAYAQAIACFTEREQQALRKQFSDSNGNLDGAQVAAAFQPLTAVPGFRFATIETERDAARVGIQTVRGGVVLEMVLQREGMDWKLKGF